MRIQRHQNVKGCREACRSICNRLGGLGGGLNARSQHARRSLCPMQDSSQVSDEVFPVLGQPLGAVHIWDHPLNTCGRREQRLTGRVHSSERALGSLSS